MLAEAFPLGPWKNFKEMEESLTLDELYLLLDTFYEGQYSNRKFAAALKGIDLDEDKEETESTFDRVRREADEILGKKNEEFEGEDPFGLDSDDEE